MPSSTIAHSVCLLVCFLAVPWLSRGDTVPAPLSLSPSQYWSVRPCECKKVVRVLTSSRDGNDGPWSTFWVQVGTPPQTVRLLPGTSATAGNTIWVVLPQGCSTDDPSDCPSKRGEEFISSKSISWSTTGLANNGLFNLVLYEEGLLGYGGNAYYGFDNVTLGLPSAGAPTLTGQVVAGIATKNFYIGSMGLSPLPMNFSSFNAPYPSVLATLKNQSKIPSTSWSYTAGAYYQDPKVFGSLTLGGYDSNRFAPNNITVSFGADQSRDLLVGIQSITTDAASSPLLSTGIAAFLDSMIPDLWLPVEVCTAFERAFNLTWSNDTGMYSLTDDQHKKLVAKNANVTFKIGGSAQGGDSVNIVMPYGAFDLVWTGSGFNSTRYFPLQRAQNSTQYTLGRAFFQQAYVIADYDRSHFTVAPALFPATLLGQKIVPVLSPGTSSSSDQKSAFGTGAIAGIAVGAVALLAAILLIVLIIRRRRTHKPPQEPQPPVGADTGMTENYLKAELDTTEVPKAELGSEMIHANKPHAELDEQHPYNNKDGTYYGPGGAELPAPGGHQNKHELPARLRGNIPTIVHELPGDDISRPELESNPNSPPFRPSPTSPSSRRSLASPASPLSRNSSGSPSLARFRLDGK